MTPFALAFVIGVWLLQQFSSLPEFHWAALLIPLALILFLRVPRSIRQLNLVLLALGLGFFWAAGLAYVRLADALPDEWEGRDIQLVGVVASMPQPQERGERFEFDVERVLTPGARVPRHISLASYTESFNHTESPQADPSVFHAGERWRLTVRLKQPHGTLNPHGFDFEAWAFERNIRATGYLRKSPPPHRLKTFVLQSAYLVEAAREKVRQHMQTALQGKRYAGILQALAIGDEAGIAQEDWQTFLHTGTNHLMSISGLHITMLAGLGFAMVNALWRRSEKLTLRLPARKAAVLASVIVALLYALIAGFSVPAQRTFFMLSVIALALWSGRDIAMRQVLAAALLAVVVLDPWAVLAPGFWLSFGAVALIAYTMAGRLGQPHWLKEAAKIQWAVSLGLVPLLLMLFNQVSIISPIANAFAIPLVSLVVVPLTLAGSLLPLGWLLGIAHEVMSWCMAALQWLSALPVSIWQQHAPVAWTLPLAILGVLWLLLPRGFPLRSLGLVMLAPMFLVQLPTPAVGQMKVAVLDVGQGLAVVVRTANHVLLYDAGPRYSGQSDSGTRVVVPYLRGEGVGHLDGMVVSHQDNDHAGGMRSVLEQVRPDWLASSLPKTMLQPLTGRHIPCFAGQSWTWDGVSFDMRYPALESYGEPPKSNNRSCVLHVRSPYGSLLLPGDIERKAERELTAADADLAADVLVVPHHGSKTSSTPEFIRRVNPQMAIFTVGYRNRFGHPKPAILARYQDIGSRAYRSDADGALLIDFTDAGIEVTQWRSQAHRYWQDVVETKPRLLAENGAAR